MRHAIGQGLLILVSILCAVAIVTNWGYPALALAFIGMASIGIYAVNL